MSFFTFTITATEPVIAFSLGPIDVRWYGLAYLATFIIGWRLAIRLGAQTPRTIQRQDFDDLVPWMLGGVILGGRLGYVFFYNFPYYSQHLAEIFYTWEGGMAFHGGLLGAITALFIFAKRRGIPFFMLTDVIAIVTPIGLFLGRIANFANGELFGRTTESPLGVVFANGGPYPRHPSQLYEAVLEGLLLGGLLLLANRKPEIRARPGVISALFLVGYGLARLSVEFFREPDVQIGYVFEIFTQGQLLSVPIVLAGLGIYIYAKRQKA
jgi:phosphatidylglycerol:prolipoprotein diacylglycerol transferase